MKTEVEMIDRSPARFAVVSLRDPYTIQSRHLTIEEAQKAAEKWSVHNNADASILEEKFILKRPQDSVRVWHKMVPDA